MALMKLRLGFLFTDLSQHFKMCLVVFVLQFFYSWSWVRGGLKSFICVLKLKSHIGGILLSGQNLLSMTKVTCRRSLKEQIAQELTEINSK